MTKTKEKKRPTVRVGYMGKCLDSSGKIGHAFDISRWSTDPDRQTAVYVTRKAPSMAIGWYYDVEHDGDPEDGLYLSASTPTSEKASRVLRERWAAASKTAETEKVAAGALKSLQKEGRDISSMTLAEAGQWLYDGRGMHSAARLAVILDELTR